MNVHYRVVQLLHEHQRVPLEKITDYAYLERDLGITGDDADELLAEFCKLFSIDSSVIDSGKHFFGEGPTAMGNGKILLGLIIIMLVTANFISSPQKLFCIFAALMMMPFFIQRLNFMEKHPIRVKDLIDIASKKQWPAEWQKDNNKQIAS